MKDINLTNKCGSCDHFKPIEDTAAGECLQNPYDDSIVHDPKHPHRIVQRSRTKCPLYNAKSQTNADRIRAMSDEELVYFMGRNSLCYQIQNEEGEWCKAQAVCEHCLLEWLKKPAEGENNVG